MGPALSTPIGSFGRGYLGARILVGEWGNFQSRVGSRDKSTAAKVGAWVDRLRSDLEFGEGFGFSKAQEMNDLEELIHIHGFFQYGYRAVF